MSCFCFLLYFIIFLLQTLTLKELLKYKGRHICKSVPTREKFYLVPTQPREKYDIDLELEVKMLVNMKEEIRDPQPVRLHPISMKELVNNKYGKGVNWVLLILNVKNSLKVLLMA